jgi:hypothetical protein
VNWIGENNMDDKNNKEFVAGHEITIQMKLTPSQCSVIQKWSENVPTLYMLDICVVGATKFSEEMLKKQPRKAKLVTTIRNLDRPDNGFSYLLALMEKVSDSRGKLTADELKEQIIKDISSLRNFFKAARVVETDDFLISFLEELMGEPIEKERPNYLNFLKKLNNHFKLHNSIAPTQRIEKAKEIILEASSNSISPQHPIVLISLACLYGNQSAKKLIKFKDNPDRFDAENALADISLISRYAKRKLELETYGRNGSYYKRVDFITDDSALMELGELFKFKAVKYRDIIGGQKSELTVDVKYKELLTDAKEDDYAAIEQALSKP